MSKYIKKYLLLIIFVLFIFSISAYAQEIEEDLTQYKTVENKIAGEPYLNPKWIEWNSLSDEEKSEWKVIPEKFIVDYVYNTNEKLLQPYSFNTYNLKPNSQTMPSTYNLKDEGYVSPIKNQSTLGLCWAFATVGSIESNALKTLGKSLIFSERQIDYALSNPISSVTEGYNPYGNTDRILGTGGNFADANKLFLGGISPQLTSIWGNYNTSSTKQSLSKIIDNNNIEYQITNTVNFPYIDMSTASDEAKDSYIKMIKEHIMNYGGVYISTITPDSRGGTCYNSQYNMSYKYDGCTHDEIDYSHAMLIIGWDDTYGPDYNGDGVGDGAWKLKNSWGSQNQYPYASYYSLEQFYNGVISIQEKNWNRSYDNTDLNTITNNSRTFYKDNSTKEYLKRISFVNNYSFKDHIYNIYISNTGITSDKVLINSITTNNPGIYSLDVDSLLLENDKFTIYVESQESSSYRVDSISAFTSLDSQTNDIKIKTIVENDSLVIDSNGNSNKKIYSITENINTGEKVDYKIYKNGSDITSDFTVSNNYVVNDNVVSEITYNKDSIVDDNYIIKSFYNGELLDEYEFNIIGKKIDSIKPSVKQIKIENGKSHDISVLVSPSNAVNKSLKWESSDTSIVSLSNNTTSSEDNNDNYSNTIIATGKGEATITISSLDGSNISEEIIVNVIKLDGDGTESNPYKIYNQYELDAIRLNTSSYYELMSDINFLTEDFSENGFFYNNGYGWNPIQSFSGNLNGNGFSINNLKILKPNTSGLSGLFSNLSNAVIKNITFNNFNIKFSSRDIYDLRTYAGIIAGKSNNSKYVNIIINNSSINADYSYSGGYAGSIVGYDEQSNFSNCSNNNVTLGSNSSISYLGGIVGYSLYGTYNNIISKAYLGGKFIVGGIVGKNKYGTFINLQSMKPTSSTSTNASHGGGLIGELTEGTLLSSVNNINAGSSPIVHEFVSRVYDSLVMDLYMPNTNYSSGIGFGYSSNNYLKNIYKGKGTVFVSSSNNDYIRNIYVPLNFSTYKDNIFPEINGSNIAYVTSSINQVCYYFDCNNIWENIDNNINLRMTNYDFEKENIHVVYGNTININSYPFNQMETDDYEVMNSNASIATIDVNNRTLTANNYGTTNITLTSKIGSKFSKEYEINVVDYINVENVLLNKDKVSLLKGENETLELTIIPTEAMNKNVTWESSNENVAIVDENGKITAVSRGTATITVISEDGEKKDTCEVTVKEPKITLGDKNINSNYDSTLYAGYGGTIIVPITTQDIEENSKLTLKYYKDDVEMTNTEFSEAFKIGGNVVTDNKVNLQIGVMASTLKGKYKIEVSTENAESKSFEFEVIPPILVEDIEANDIILIINQNIKVNYKITNDNAMNKKVSFSIRNKDESLTTLIATIDEQGVITANQIGEGILTIEAKDGSGVKKEINLTIIDDFDIKTAKYVIDENLNIHKIKDKLVLEDFIKDFEVNSNIIAKIYKNDSEIDYTKPLGTGYKLKTYSNEELINEYTLIVSGDLNGDGNANATDILAQKLHILNKTQLKEEYFTAGDINEDGKVNATDILYIKMYILEKYSTVWGK